MSSSIGIPYQKKIKVFDIFKANLKSSHLVNQMSWHYTHWITHKQASKQSKPFSKYQFICHSISRLICLFNYIFYSVMISISDSKSTIWFERMWDGYANNNMLLFTAEATVSKIDEQCLSYTCLFHFLLVNFIPTTEV